MKKLAIGVILLFSFTDSFAQEAFDRIFRLDRSEIKSTIDEIGEFEITYFELGAPEIKKSIRVSAVWKIVRAAGEEQVFNEPLPLEISENASEGDTSTDSTLVVAGAAGALGQDGTPTESKEKFSLKNLNFYVDNRPIYALRIGVGPQILSDARSWVSTLPSDGLGFRFGVMADLGLEFNFHQLFGVSLTTGFSTASSSLDFLGEEAGLEGDKLKLTTIPTTFKAKYYPMDGLSLSAGLVFNSLTLSADDPIVDKSNKVGFTFGVSRLAPIGRGKNLFEIGINYTKVGLQNPEQFSLNSSTDGSPLMGPFELDKLGYVSLTLAYQIGIFNK